ncbi:MAG TPA: 16S rRNA (cytidine(1402)-2'-O)-methyltransferase [Gammaproteobacteria bacterium]|nr:16S rRNA (cytidine(1402)-2'-O)-methyltransferase [Gammaproteobacteria bacterium]
MSNSKGILYIVATPIGNLQDMTPRAVQVLSEVQLIAAEDTRHSAKLLQHFGIKTPCLALHEHNEREASAALVQRLLAGDAIALISDAGTPLISDPGYHLVQAARAAGLRVVPIPGACALTSALSASGLPSDRFVFEGFLPARAAARRARLEELQHEPRTLIFYESPHRILECLDDLAQVFGAERPAVIARELSKLFETIHDGSLSALCAWLRSDVNQQKGEFVILVRGSMLSEQGEEDSEAERVLRILMAELPVKQAAALAAQITGRKKNALYELALQQKN